MEIKTIGVVGAGQMGNGIAQVAAEAGYDMDRFCDNLRKWAAEHPHDGPVVHNAEELQQLIAAKERGRAAQPAVALNEEPPRSGKL